MECKKTYCSQHIRRGWGGHYAVRGTLLKLNGIAWWPEIQVDVELLVCTCELCLRNKHARAPGREGALPSVTINEHVHLDDIITPQPVQRRRTGDHPGRPFSQEVDPEQGASRQIGQDCSSLVLQRMVYAPWVPCTDYV